MGIAVGVLALAITACGGSASRQDEDEPGGKFDVEIVTSQFPTRQRLAETSELRLGVRNTGERTVPALAVTISLDQNAIRPFSVRDPQPGLADPDRPVWILEQNYPKVAARAGASGSGSASAGSETANDKTFDFGPLAPGKTVEAVWQVTPVRAGRYTLDYLVDAGLYGKAKAVTADGSPPSGSFAVRISSEPPQTRINDQGDVIVVSPGGSGKSKGGSGKSQGGGTAKSNGGSTEEGGAG